MIRARLCFVAEAVTTDRDSGQVSAHSFVENVEAARYPVTIQKLAFFTLWERTPADPSSCQGDLTVTVCGREVLRQPIEINFGSLLRHRSTVRLEGLTTEKPGPIVFRLAVSGHDVAEWVVTANVTASGADPS